MNKGDLPDLSSLRTLTQVADGGSLAAAGRAAGVSASAVGKSLSRLEARMGLRLFHRTTRNLTLTDEGAVVLAHARIILGEADALREELSGRVGAPSGRLRIALPLVGEPFLGVLAGFSQAYPGIELDIDFSDRQVDIVAEGFDAAIRSGPMADTRLMAKSLGSFRMELFASPAYLDRNGTPESVANLVGHRQIRFRFSHNGKIGTWPVEGIVDDGPASAVTCNNLEARVAFTVGGLGIGLLPSFAVRQHLHAGSLIAVLKDVGEDVPLTLLWPSGLPVAAKLRAFADHMAMALPRAIDGHRHHEL